MAGILGPWVQLEIFSSAFITAAAAAAAAAAACSFAGACWLKSCSAWELAEPWQAAPGVFITGCSDVTEKGPYLGCVLASPLSQGRSCSIRGQPAHCTIAATKPFAATCCGSLQTARAPNPVLEGALARSPWSNCARWGPQLEAQMNQRGKEEFGKELQAWTPNIRRGREGCRNSAEAPASGGWSWRCVGVRCRRCAPHLAPARNTPQILSSFP